MVNSIEIIGYAAADGEMIVTNGGTEIGNLTVPTSRRWQDAGGEWQEKTQWHRVKAFGKIAARFQQIKKGDVVRVVGELNYEDWTDKEGNKRTSAVIVARELKTIVRKDKGAGAEAGAVTAESYGPAGRSAVGTPTEFNFDQPADDDLPF